nr:hypothetical protein [Comamonas testosteroni]
MFRTSVVTLSAALGLGAQAANPGTAFEARFAPLYARVFTEGASFSGSAMSAELKALEPLLRKPEASARDIFRLYYTEASVFGRRQMPEQAAKAAQMALAAMPVAPAANDVELAYAHFFLRYSSIRWLAASKDYDAALKQVRAFQTQYPLQSLNKLPAQMRWEQSGDTPKPRDFPSQMQLLAVYEDEGYVLHEQRKFREARQANEKLLPVSRELTQAAGQPERLRGVLTNLAQNCYELGDFDQARSYLLERLKIAQTAKDHDTVYDCFFQLMVLAHEQKQTEQAKQWLAAYEQYAKAQKDSEQLERVKDLRAELASKQAARKP